MKVLQKKNLVAWLSDEVEIWASCSSKIYGQILLRYFWTGSTAEARTFWGGNTNGNFQFKIQWRVSSKAHGPGIWFNIEIKALETERLLGWI